MTDEVLSRALDQDASVDACVDRVRQLILTGVLLPGEKVHQANLASRLGVSRVPIREALSALRSEGLLDARPNVGYTVARPTVEDLHEVYLMRELLENVLLDSIEVDEVDATRLREINDELATLDPATHFARYRSLNEEFHAEIFDRSPLHLVRRHVTQLWTLSDFYRSIYVRNEKARERVVADHALMIDAIERGDRAALVSASDAHRAESRDWVAMSLARRA